MKDISTLIFTLTLATAHAKGSTIVCRQGQAFIYDTTWDTGCVNPPEPFIKALTLQSESPSKGKIAIEMDYTFPTKDPNCDNPRGTPHFFWFPLPVKRGIWEIAIAKRGVVTFDFKNCQE